MRKLDSTTQEHGGADHILSLLKTHPVGLVAATFSAATRPVDLRVREQLHYHCSAGSSGARERQPICISIARTHCISPVLLPARQNFKSAKHHFRPRHWLICGYAAFVVTGAGASPFGVHQGIFWPRILAAALSLYTTGAFMILFETSHPPAGATTLIVSLGIISKPRELVIIKVAVFLLVAQALLINRLAGLP